MEYITRDLQHKTKEILDKAVFAPVLIRRGSEFFEVYKVKMNGDRPAIQESPAPKDEWVEVRTQRDILADITALEADCADKLDNCQDYEESSKIKKDYENRVKKLWEEYNGPTPSVKSGNSLDDLMNTGAIRKGI